MHSKSVLLVAGGSGSRMQSSVPKQFLEVCGKPLIVHTIECFLDYDRDMYLVLVLPEDHVMTWRAIQEDFLPDVTIEIAQGGTSRVESVRSGLRKVHTDLVAIHDAVRPLISSSAIDASFKSAIAYGSGVLMVPLKDSIRKSKPNNETQALNRSEYYAVQTPQTFRVDEIKKAFADQGKEAGFTDDASVYEAAGKSVVSVPGEYRNIKVTTPEDLLIVEVLLKQFRKLL